MTRRLHAALLAGVLAAGAVACGDDGAGTAVEESPTAAPAMEGETAPSLGPGATEGTS